MQEAVDVLGAVTDRGSIAQLFLEADIFVLPSYLGEAQPLTIIEALSSGTPAVVVDERAMPDMIQGSRCGRVVPPWNPEAIAQAVTELADPATWRSCSSNARSRFESAYECSHVDGLWNQLIRSTTPKEQA